MSSLRMKVLALADELGIADREAFVADIDAMLADILAFIRAGRGDAREAVFDAYRRRCSRSTAA